ncbi:hypothetical protein [Frankia sp. CiP3]|uniref:hypothetical protein n=1 Tax=Frankia sp. CiP3 TaxID=2880971 RepID=UPI001EF5DA0D|nr:hypothetical protein [Frankia sp. CiP3]
MDRTDENPDNLDLIDLLQHTGFTPRDEHPAGRPNALMFDRDGIRVVLDDGELEIHTFGPAPARLPRWSVTVSPTAPLLLIIDVLHIAGVPTGVTDAGTP